MKKYELTNETKVVNGVTFHRIRALRDFSDVCKGSLGGWVEHDGDLDHEGNAWIYGNARVEGDAWIGRNARVEGSAWIAGDARVEGSGWIG